MQCASWICQFHLALACLLVSGSLSLPEADDTLNVDNGTSAVLKRNEFHYTGLNLVPAVTKFGFGPGTVYLVIGSDTAIWNNGNTVDVFTRHPTYPQDFYTNRVSPSYLVMEPSWRYQFKDSFGVPVKFTWWMMGGNIYREASNRNVPIPNTMVLYLMKKYHGKAIRQFGDELSFHYHTFIWSDYNGDGQFCWNQARAFQECRVDFDFTLSQYLLEEDVFPVSFRSGWHFRDNEWQRYLDQIVPFSMDNNWPAKRSWYTNEPINNVQDWSRSPSEFIPFHPATNDYQVPGKGRGWNVRSIKMQNMTQLDMNGIFAKASNGIDQVVCIWNHLPENFIENFTRIDGLAHISAENSPGVKFRYCTAVEAMQRWMQTSDTSPPIIDIEESNQAQTVTLSIRTSEPIFQPQPFIAIRDAFQQYTNITSSSMSTGPDSWSITLPVPRNLLAKVGVAATDLAGNVSTRILRFLPDDLYFDNLDAGYSEVLGNWKSTKNASWGTDARIAQLTSKDIARARWFLPVDRSGMYQISTQVPILTNAASNVSFFIDSSGSNSHLITFSASIPGHQWVKLGTPFLDHKLTNCLEMVVYGANQTGMYAVADAIKIVPIPDSARPWITMQPLSRTNFSGTVATFNVAASSYGEITYQWRHGTNVLAGETNATITIPNVHTVNAGDYSVLLTNSAGVTTSKTAVLTVVPVSQLQPNQLSISRTPEGFILWYFGKSGQRYEIQRCFPSQALWSTIGSIMAPTDGLLGYEEKNPPGTTAFYRIAYKRPN